MTVKKVLIMLWVGGLMVHIPVVAQDYDYHREESPAVSWNSTVLFDARMLALGGISLMASPAFAASVNPAVIPPGNHIFIGGSFESMKQEAFQYWGINQGIFIDPDPQSGRNYHFSGVALTFPVKGFCFSAGWYVPNLLELPAFDYEGQYWEYSVHSTGQENAFFAAAAFKLGKSLDIGVKVDMVSGKREVKIDELWEEYPVQIMHRERHRLNYLAPSLGAVLKISPAWSVGACVIYPLKGKVKRTIDRVFESAYERIELLDQKSTDTLYRPTRFYLGTTMVPWIGSKHPGQKKLTLAAEMVYTLWSDYRYEFYAETLPRDLRNTLVLALGMEYGSSDFSLRLGYRLDPQPLNDPAVTLQAITGGLGLRWGRVSLEAGAAYYFGSSQGIKQKHLVLNSTLIYALGGR